MAVEFLVGKNRRFLLVAQFLFSQRHQLPINLPELPPVGFLFLPLFVEFRVMEMVGILMDSDFQALVRITPSVIDTDRRPRRRIKPAVDLRLGMDNLQIERLLARINLQQFLRKIAFRFVGPGR